MTVLCADKTGTLTKGEQGVVAFATNEFDRQEALSIAAGIEGDVGANVVFRYVDGVLGGAGGVVGAVPRSVKTVRPQPARSLHGSAGAAAGWMRCRGRFMALSC